MYVRKKSHLLEQTHGVGNFAPCLVEFEKKLSAEVGQRVVFPWRSLCALLPLIFQQAPVLHAGEQRIERALHHQQVGILQLADDIGGVGGLMLKQQQDAIFQHPFPHLRFHVFYIHKHHFFADYSLLRCKYIYFYSTMQYKVLIIFYNLTFIHNLHDYSPNIAPSKKNQHRQTCRC